MFFEKSEKFFRWIFQAAQAAKGGLGVATPTRFPQDKIERLAKFGTVVESCSKKSTLRLGVLFTQFLLLCPTTDNLRFCQTERQTFFNAAHFRRNGRKKSSKPFSDLLLVCAAMTAAGIQLYLLISVRQIGIHRSCTSFPLICSISISNI